MNEQRYRPEARLQPDPATVETWAGGRLEHPEKAPPRLRGMATLEQAGPEEISFCADPKHVEQARASQAGLLLVPEGLELPARPCVRVDLVWPAVARVMEQLYPDPAGAPGVDPSACVGEGCVLGEDVSIGPYCVLGEGCTIGAGARLGPHCIIGAGCHVGPECRLVARVTLTGHVVLGHRVTIHPGAVLGSDGFKFEQVEGHPLKIPQVGAVVIEDDVEIGANATIDRAFLHETRIERGVKIDNLVQIAHNCHIGEGTMMAAQVGVAGSTRIGAGCLVGGGAGFADGLTLGEGSIVGARSGVHGDWPPRSRVIGAPAMPMRQFWRVAAAQAKLPEYIKRLRAIEQKLETPHPPDQAG